MGFGILMAAYSVIVVVSNILSAKLWTLGSPPPRVGL